MKFLQQNKSFELFCTVFFPRQKNLFSNHIFQENSTKLILNSLSTDSCSHKWWRDKLWLPHVIFALCACPDFFTGAIMETRKAARAKVAARGTFKWMKCWLLRCVSIVQNRQSSQKKAKALLHTSYNDILCLPAQQMFQP